MCPLAFLSRPSVYRCFVDRFFQIIHQWNDHRQHEHRELWRGMYPVEVLHHLRTGERVA